MSFIKGDTVFRPPDYEFRITPILAYPVNAQGEDEDADIGNW